MFQALLFPSSGALSDCSRSLWFPFKCRGGCVSSRGRFVSTNKHIRLCIYTETGGGDCSLKELLMMGIIMPETCWAVSMQLSNKFYDWSLHLVGRFIWILQEKLRACPCIWMFVFTCSSYGSFVIRVVILFNTALKRNIFSYILHDNLQPRIVLRMGKDTWRVPDDMLCG
jgi:hypothetical protein